MKVISLSTSLIAYLNTGLNRLFHEVNVNLNELMVFKFYRLSFFLNIMFLHELTHFGLQAHFFFFLEASETRD